MKRSRDAPMFLWKILVFNATKNEKLYSVFDDVVKSVYELLLRLEEALMNQ